MIATHRTTMHGVCPIHGGWDYYDVEIECPAEHEIDVDDIESILDNYRGMRITQEVMQIRIAKFFAPEVTIRLVGRHGINCTTTTVSKGTHECINCNTTTASKGTHE